MTILRGKRELFDELAMKDGYTLRVLDEDRRTLVKRRIAAVEVRAYPSWLEAALHDLPPNQYRIQLITPLQMAKTSVTVDWRGPS